MSFLEELNQKLGGGNPELLKQVIGMLQGPDGNGLERLVESFRQEGLGEIISSWIGQGPNQPVSPEQLQAVLGEQIKTWEERLGIPQDVIGQQLCQLLPSLVDRLTPEGELPEDVQDQLYGQLQHE